jgi:heat shock protein HslJ
LPGTEWQLSSYSDGVTTGSGQDIRTITLKFDDSGTISGFSGVNSYFGVCTMDGSIIFIGPLGSTKMAGPESLMTLEQLYFNLLTSATGVSLSGDSLSLTNNEGTAVLTFEPKTTASQDRHTAIILPVKSHVVRPPATWGHSLTTTTDRFYKNGSWIGSTGVLPVKLVQPGKGIINIPATGKNQRPSTMPRFNDSIIPPVTYPGGPLY